MTSQNWREQTQGFHSPAFSTLEWKWSPQRQIGFTWEHCPPFWKKNLAPLWTISAFCINLTGGHPVVDFPSINPGLKIWRWALAGKIYIWRQFVKATSATAQNLRTLLSCKFLLHLSSSVSHPRLDFTSSKWWRFLTQGLSRDWDKNNWRLTDRSKVVRFSAVALYPGVENTNVVQKAAHTCTHSHVMKTFNFTYMYRWLVITYTNVLCSEYFAEYSWKVQFMNSIRIGAGHRCCWYHYCV